MNAQTLEEQKSTAAIVNRAVEEIAATGELPSPSSLPETAPGPHMVKVFHNHGNPINKHYVTLACGHRFAAAARQQPRGGCTTCWRTYFLENPDIAHATGLILTNPQNSSWKEAMLASQGKEFVKQAKSFLQWEKTQNPQPESSEESQLPQ